MGEAASDRPAEFETQREPVPRVDTGELDTALAFLDFVRSCALKKTDGLDDEQLRRALVPSGTSLLGLIQHLATGERFWIGFQVAGVGRAEDFDFDLKAPADRDAAAVLADYRASIVESNDIIRRIGDPDAPMAVPVDGTRLTLRWVLAHLTGETTRHAGHADILRELIDGTTGR